MVVDDSPGLRIETAQNKEADDMVDIGDFIQSNFCKYLGKPRRISVEHAKDFKTIQSNYKDSVHRALSNLNDGKLTSQEYLIHDQAASDVTRCAGPLPAS